MTTQLIIAYANGYNCAAVFVNQVVIAEADSTVEIERLVVKAGRQLRVALNVPLMECTVDVPIEMDGKWQWPDLYPMLPLVVDNPIHEVQEEQLLSELKTLYKGYVRTLEAGRDRIISLHGDCDPVDVMERNDPWLISARKVIANL